MDPLYSAALAALVTLSATRSARGTWLWLATVAAVFSRGLLLIPAGVALAGAFASALPRRAPRAVGVLVAAVACQVVLRWPHFGFQGATALLAGLAVGPSLVHGFLHMSPRARHWVLLALSAGGVLVIVLVVPAAAEMALSRGQASRGVAATDVALAAVRHGDAETATAELAAGEDDFRAVQGRTDSWWTYGARLVPIASQQARAVARAAQVAAQVAGVARTQAEGMNFSRLRYLGGNAGVDLKQIESFSKPVATVNEELTSGLARLDSARSPWLVGPLRSRFDRLYSEVAKARGSVAIADESIQDLPRLLGADRPRTYLVALLDTSESRGLGGVLVWCGQLKAVNGRISIAQFGDANQIRADLAARGGGHLSGPADFLSRYGRFDPQDTFIDSSYAPDLPTTAEVVSQLYTEAGHGPIDGVLVLDPRSLASMLQVTGPVQTPGLGELTSANTARMLESTEYSLYPAPSQQDARRQALANAMQLVSERLLSTSLPGPSGLVDLFGGDVQRGDLGFWSLHPKDQPLLRSTGLADAFPSPNGGDLLSVVTQNAANNKIDAYLQRTVTDRVRYARSRGEVSASVTVNLRNSAPASGLSYVVIDGYPGIANPPLRLQPGTNLTWVTLYSPLDLLSVTEDGKSLEFQAGEELGVKAYSTYVQLRAGETNELEFRLKGSLRPGAPYRLTVHEQPMVLPDQVAVEFVGGTDAAMWHVPDSVTVFRKFAN